MESEEETGREGREGWGGCEAKNGVMKANLRCVLNIVSNCSWKCNRNIAAFPGPILQVWGLGMRRSATGTTGLGYQSVV